MTVCCSGWIGFQSNQDNRRLSIFPQPLHISGLSRPIIRRYNRCIQQVVLTILFRWLLSGLDWIPIQRVGLDSNPTRTTDGLVYFLNLYMFQAYLSRSSEGTTICIQQLVLTILFRWLSAVRVELDSNPTRTTNGLGYFLNVYMFQVYLGRSSGGTTDVYNKWYLLFFLDDCLLFWLDWIPIQPGQQTD